MKHKRWVLLGLVSLGLVACQSHKHQSRADFTALAVNDFAVESYMGRWYEVGRFDFFWQKNLKNVTADYTLQPDGSIEVDNQGVDLTTGERKRNVGKAKFNGPSNRGALQVAFFGPFYSQYNIVQLNNDGRYALVFGKNTDYVWLLSRDKTMPEAVKQAYVAYAQQAGYDTSRMVWTQQD